MAKSFGTLVALLCFCFLLLSHTEMRVVEAEKCVFFSTTYQATDCADEQCSADCRNKESTIGGECMTLSHPTVGQFPLKGCFCQYPCSSD